MTTNVSAPAAWGTLRGTGALGHYVWLRLPKTAKSVIPPTDRSRGTWQFFVFNGLQAKIQCPKNATA